MIQVSTAKDAALSRISAIVSELIKTNNLDTEELDKNELMQIFSDLLDRVVTPEEMIYLDGDRLTKRVKGVMASEATAAGEPSSGLSVSGSAVGMAFLIYFLNYTTEFIFWIGKIGYHTIATQTPYPENHRSTGSSNRD